VSVVGTIFSYFRVAALGGGKSSNQQSISRSAGGTKAFAVLPLNAPPCGVRRVLLIVRLLPLPIMEHA
jgi:hypothetical protein